MQTHRQTYGETEDRRDAEEEKEKGREEDAILMRAPVGDKKQSNRSAESRVGRRRRRRCRHARPTAPPTPPARPSSERTPADRPTDRGVVTITNYQQTPPRLDIVLQSLPLIAMAV